MVGGERGAGLNAREERAYRKAISKLSLSQLQDALVREAQLREAAQNAVYGLRHKLTDLGNSTRAVCQKIVRDSHTQMLQPIAKAIKRG